MDRARIARASKNPDGGFANQRTGTLPAVAERGGFEPPVPVRAQRFSRPSQSTTLPPLRIRRPPAQLLKESLQELAGASFLESAFDVEAVIQARVLDEVPERAAEAGLRVVGPEDQPLDARVHQRPGAHRARLEGNDHRRSFEPPVAH